MIVIKDTAVKNTIKYPFQIPNELYGYDKQDASVITAMAKFDKGVIIGSNIGQFAIWVKCKDLFKEENGQDYLFYPIKIWKLDTI